MIIKRPKFLEPAKCNAKGNAIKVTTNESNLSEIWIA
jgi:hypothetical protein